MLNVYFVTTLISGCLPKSAMSTPTGIACTLVLSRESEQASFTAAVNGVELQSIRTVNGVET
jgi:hypothetical protein